MNRCALLTRASNFYDLNIRELKTGIRLYLIRNVRQINREHIRNVIHSGLSVVTNSEHDHTTA